MEPHHQRPAILWLGPVGREDADLEVGTRGFDAGDGEVDCRADWELRAATREKNAAGAGRSEGLEVDLLVVDYVGVVEGEVGGVEFGEDGGVDWVRGLCHCEGLGLREFMGEEILGGMTKCARDS